MKKDEFKEFVKNNPRLLRYVKNNEMTWQKFYEMYDMYGADHEVWKSYLEDKTDEKSNIGVKDIANYLKNINLDSVQESINSIQRVLGVLGDLTGNKVANTNTNTYEPKPIYKHFDD